MKKLRASVALCSVFAACAAMPAAAQTLSLAEDEQNDVIVVTGSHIVAADHQSGSPILSVSREAIDATGKTNITDVLIRNPALSASIGPAQSSGAIAPSGNVGVNVLNLRNLGPQRTLVLVNGKRHVSGVTNTAAVDLNSIPIDLIERVDILTGGASAIYGADGVSGVVNFVLKRDFEGLSARAQAGVASRGDAATTMVSAVAGKNFADDRGNITLAYEYNKADRLHSGRRKVTGDPKTYSRLVGDLGQLNGYDDPAVYDYFRQNSLTWAYSSPKGVVATADGLFLGDGTAYDPGTPLGFNSFAIGGNNTPVAGYYGDLLPATERHTANVLAHYEFSPAFRVYGEGKYVSNKAHSVGQPAWMTNLVLAPFNPFVEERFGTQPDGVLIVGRDSFDLGRRGERTKRETYRAVIGMDGEISDHLRYDLSYVYGRTVAQTALTSNILTDRLYAALNVIQDFASGQNVCLSSLYPDAPIDFQDPSRVITTFTPGANSPCRPLNLLGDGVADQAAIDFIMADGVNRSRISQQVLSGVLSGDSGGFFSLPGGPVRFALGAEYRQEKSRFNPSDYVANGEIFEQGPIPTSGGSFDVSEMFGEVSLPLLLGHRFAETLTIGAAGRFSDYSTIGSTTAWKLDMLYAPIRDVQFRATYSKAVRAPNILELFQEKTPTFQFVNDPCHIAFRGNGAPSRAENCEAILSNLGLSDPQIAAFTPALNAGVRGEFQGNRSVQEERAKSWTAGFTVQPRFVPGLTLSFDWYDIKVRGAIGAPSAHDMAELCVDQASIDNAYCASLFRDPASGALLGDKADPAQRIGFLSSYFNVAYYETAGADFGIQYRFAPSQNFGQFQVGLNGGYLDRMRSVAVTGGEVDDNRLEANNPRWRGQAHVAWSLNNVSLHYGVNYWSKTLRFPVETLAAQPDITDPKNLWFKAKLEHDVRGAVTVNDKFEVYAGVNNLFDRQPDFGELAYPMSAVGRYLYAGVKVSIF